MPNVYMILYAKMFLKFWCMTLSQQVVVDTAQIENKEAYAPQISLEGSKVVVQVPSTW